MANGRTGQRDRGWFYCGDNYNNSTNHFPEEFQSHVLQQVPRPPLPFGGTQFIVPHFSVSATDPRLNSLSLSPSLSTSPVCDLVRYCIPLLIILIRSFVVAVNGSTTTRDQSSSSTYLLEGHPLSPTAAYRRQGPASG